MKLKQLTIRNFMSIKKATLELDNAGLVLVQGVNDDDSAFDSNGAGKSTVFEAITYALFERTIRGLKSDEIINEDMKRNCSVILTLEDGDTKYEIQRYRKHKEHRNNTIINRDNVNVSGKSTKDSNIYIEKLIGMDFSTFTNSILFGQGVVKLFSMASDKEKKDILEKMLSMDVFNAALEITKDKLKSKVNDQDATQRQITTKESSLESAKENLAYFEQLQRTHQEETQANIDQLKRDKAKVEREIADNQSTEQYTSLIKTIDEKIGELNNRKEMYNEQLATRSELQNKLNNLKTDYAFENRVAKQETENLVKLKQENDDLESGVGKNCPACGNEITGDSISKELDYILGRMETSLGNIKASEDKAKQLNEMIKDVSSEIVGFNKAEELIKGIDQEISEYKDNRSQLSTQLTIIETTAKHLNTQLTNINANLAKEEAELNKGFTDKIEEHKKSVEMLTKDIDNLKNTNIKLTKEVEKLRFWVDGFGNSGIKSYLLDSVTPYLNKRANHYLSKLAGGTTEIEFSTQTRLKSGEVRDKFEVRINNKVGGTSYHSNSTGERKRIDLAISLALQDLVMTRSNGKFNILLYDEVFDGLDAVGCENAIQLLTEIQEGVPSVFVITHNDVLKSYFENTLTVTKRNGETTVSSIV